MQARWGTHGIIRLSRSSPTSVMECFTLTVKAFNYSEKYRTPVILLMDEVVATCGKSWSCPIPAKSRSSTG